MARVMTKSEQERRLADLLARMKIEARPFPEDSRADREARVRKVQESFSYFCRTYLPHYFDTALSPFHQELAELMEIQGVPVVVGAARGHGKSTITTLAKPLYDTVMGRRHFIVIVSSTDMLAELQTAAIRLELEENERICADFGDLSNRDGGRWARGNFVTRTGVLILARGRGQGVRGMKHGPYRPDLVVFDDAETESEARNPTLVKRLVAYAKETLIPALARQGRWSFFWIDTKKARGSALDRMLDENLEDGEGWVRREYPALDDQEQPLCPELHSLGDLGDIRQAIGTVAFNKEYLLIVVDMHGLFREEWFKTYELSDLKEELAYGLTVAFIDPSVKSGAELGDYKAIVVVTRHPETADLYVRDAWIRHASIDAMVESTYDLHARWGCRWIGLETVAFSELLFRDFDRAAQEKGLHLPLTKVNQHLSKEARIASLSPLHERGVLWFPKGFPNDLQVLKNQLLPFPSSAINDDGPDALEGAIRLLEEFETVTLPRVLKVRRRR